MELSASKSKTPMNFTILPRVQHTHAIGNDFPLKLNSTIGTISSYKSHQSSFLIAMSRNFISATSSCQWGPPRFLQANTYRRSFLNSQIKFTLDSLTQLTNLFQKSNILVTTPSWKPMNFRTLHTDWIHTIHHSLDFIKTLVIGTSQWNSTQSIRQHTTMTVHSLFTAKWLRFFSSFQ